MHYTTNSPSIDKPSGAYISKSTRREPRRDQEDEPPANTQKVPSTQGERATREQVKRALALSVPVSRRSDATQQVSEVHEATGYYFAALKLPAKRQPFVRVLLAAAHGETGQENLLELSDLAIGKRLCPERAAEIEALKHQRAELQTATGVRPMRLKEINETLERRRNSLARLAARERAALREWQSANNIEIVFAVDGVRKFVKGGGEEDVPSRYRLDALRQIAEVIELARSDRDFDQSPALAYKCAASTVAQKIKREKVVLPEKREIKPEAILKQAKSWSRKYAQLFRGEPQRLAVRVLAEFVAELAVDCGAEIDGILPVFSDKPFISQQDNGRTVFASPDVADEKPATLLSFLEECQLLLDQADAEQVALAPPPETAQAEVADLPEEMPARAIGQAPAEFAKQADEARQRYQAEQRYERARAAFEKSFSLAEIEAVNTRQPKGSGAWKQYLICPACGGSSGHDKKGRLSVNTRTGGYRCHYAGCETKGKLREFWENPPTEWSNTARPTISREEIEAKRRAQQEQEAQENAAKAEQARALYAQAMPLAENRAAWDYVQRRTGAAEVAERLGVRFTQYEGTDHEGKGRAAILFALRDQHGEVVATSDRQINDAWALKAFTTGPKMLGVFATPHAFDAAKVLIVEAPLEAIAAYECGFEAVATCGTSYPAWLPDALAGQHVFLGQNNDKPDRNGKRAGDEAATRLANDLLGRAAIVERLKPSLKDFVEIVEQRGLDALRAELAGAQFDGQADGLEDEEEEANEETAH